MKTTLKDRYTNDTLTVVSNYAKRTFTVTFKNGSSFKTTRLSKDEYDRMDIYNCTYGDWKNALKIDTWYDHA